MQRLPPNLSMAKCRHKDGGKEIDSERNALATAWSVFWEGTSKLGLCTRRE